MYLLVDEEQTNKQITIIISHHLSTIRPIDKITMIHNGIIVELETHNDLIKCNEMDYILISKMLKLKN